MMDVPIPQCYDQLCHISQGISVRPSESKVGDFDLSTIVHEKIARLEVPVDDPVIVT